MRSSHLLITWAQYLSGLGGFFPTLFSLEYCEYTGLVPATSCGSYTHGKNSALQHMS